MSATFGEATPSRVRLRTVEEGRAFLPAIREGRRVTLYRDSTCGDGDRLPARWPEAKIRSDLEIREPDRLV
jgi:hypothetical protein